jgi:hypothetical protein
MRLFPAIVTRFPCSSTVRFIAVYPGAVGIPLSEKAP